MPRWLGWIVLVVALAGPVAAAEDLSLISEVERLRQAVEVCRVDRQYREDQLILFRAYILKLEERVKTLETPTPPKN